MSDNQAKITSVETMERFYTAMNSFSVEAMSCLDKVRCEMLRRQQMVEHELPARWNAQLQKWHIKLKDAQREMRSKNTATGRLEAEQTAQVAKSKIREAEEKLSNLKKWLKRLPLELPQCQSRLLKLKTFLSNDFDKAAVKLGQQIESLRKYSEVDKGGSQ